MCDVKTKAVAVTTDVDGGNNYFVQHFYGFFSSTDDSQFHFSFFFLFTLQNYYFAMANLKLNRLIDVRFYGIKLIVKKFCAFEDKTI